LGNERSVTVRAVRRGGQERAFDREFCRKIGPEGRFAAAREMVCEADFIRGKNAGQPRLQRSVRNILRRKG